MQREYGGLIYTVNKDNYFKKKQVVQRRVLTEALACFESPKIQILIERERQRKRVNNDIKCFLI